MDPVTLETPRLLLRPFAPADAAAVYTACQDPAIQYYTPVASPFGHDDAEAYVTRTAPEGWSTDRDYILGAFRKNTGPKNAGPKGDDPKDDSRKDEDPADDDRKDGDNGALVGSFCLTPISQGVYELGYWTDSRQRGQGLATEAARALCDWGFTALAAHRIEWWAMVGNTASRALAEKIGFTLEGTLRNRSLVEGRPHDWWVGGLLKHA